jgi:hypothetical protein
VRLGPLAVQLAGDCLNAQVDLDSPAPQVWTWPGAHRGVPVKVEQADGSSYRTLGGLKK